VLEVRTVLWMLLVPAAFLAILPLMAGLERFTDRVEPRRDSDES
jgi:hypothetical protein